MSYHFWLFTIITIPRRSTPSDCQLVCILQPNYQLNLESSLTPLTISIQLSLSDRCRSVSTNQKRERSHWPIRSQQFDKTFITELYCSRYHNLFLLPSAIARNGPIIWLSEVSSGPSCLMPPYDFVNMCHLQQKSSLSPSTAFNPKFLQNVFYFEAFSPLKLR